MQAFSQGQAILLNEQRRMREIYKVPPRRTAGTHAWKKRHIDSSEVVLKLEGGRQTPEGLALQEIADNADALIKMISDIKRRATEGNGAH